jgi:hypothetical protein
VRLAAERLDERRTGPNSGDRKGPALTAALNTMGYSLPKERAVPAHGVPLSARSVHALRACFANRWSRQESERLRSSLLVEPFLGTEVEQCT